MSRPFRCPPVPVSHLYLWKTAKASISLSGSPSFSFKLFTFLKWLGPFTCRFWCVWGAQKKRTQDMRSEHSPFCLSVQTRLKAKSFWEFSVCSKILARCSRHDHFHTWAKQMVCDEVRGGLVTKGQVALWVTACFTHREALGKPGLPEEINPTLWGKWGERWGRETRIQD